MKRMELRSNDGLANGWSSRLGWHSIPDPIGNLTNIRPEAGWIPLCTLGSESSAAELQLMTMPGTKDCLVWINWYFGSYEFVIVPSSVDGLEFLRLYAPVVSASNSDLMVSRRESPEIPNRLEAISKALQPPPEPWKEWEWRMPRWLFKVLAFFGFVGGKGFYSTGEVKSGYRGAVRYKVRDSA